MYEAPCGIQIIEISNADFRQSLTYIFDFVYTYKMNTQVGVDLVFVDKIINLCYYLNEVLSV
jgi:hypothetical protein